MRQLMRYQDVWEEGDTGGISFDLPFYDNLLSLDTPEFIQLIGDVGSGKGALLTSIGEWFKDNNVLVYDFLASDVDHENLCWAIPGSGGERHKILLVHSSYYNVEVPEDMRGWIRCETDKLGLLELSRIAASEDRVFVFDVASYRTQDYLNILTEWLSGDGLVRTHLQIHREFKKKGLILLRELHKVLPSQGVSQAASEGNALKENIKKTVKERRHSKLFMMFDTQRDIDIDKGVRGLVTLRIVRKSQDRILLDDVKMFNDVIMKFRERAHFVPMISALVPRLDELSIKQMYAYKTYGRMANRLLFRKDIDLPRCGYLDSFNQDIEDILGIIYHEHKSGYKEYSTTKVDMSLEELKPLLVDQLGGGYRTVHQLYQKIDYEGNSIEFRKQVDELQRQGFLAKRSIKEEGGSYPVYELSDISQFDKKQLVSENRELNYIQRIKRPLAEFLAVLSELHRRQSKITYGTIASLAGEFDVLIGYKGTTMTRQGLIRIRKELTRMGWIGKDGNINHINKMRVPAEYRVFLNQRFGVSL
jgi:hypothetical protein